MQDFKKVINPGKLPGFCSVPVNVFCSIKYEKERLSISGVIGPRSNGDAWGGCGQIGMEFLHRNPAHNDRRYSNPIPPNAFQFSDGWDSEKWLIFLDVWKNWHLNDMRPYCIHQKALGWGEKAGEERTLYNFTLKTDVSNLQRKIKEAAIEALTRGETVTPTEEESRILALPYWVTTTTPEAPPEYRPSKNEVSRRASETKTLGWLKPSEHPEGLLGRPCPECGYKYGHGWKREAVPESVLNFILDLPESTVEPAWV